MKVGYSTCLFASTFTPNSSSLTRSTSLTKFTCKMVVGTINVSPNSTELSVRVAKYVTERAHKAIAERGVFNVAVSGGSLPKLLANELTKSPYKEDSMWKSWNLYFADERCVSLSDSDSNYKLVLEEFLNFVSIPSSQIYPIDPSLSPQECALNYSDLIAKQSGMEFTSEKYPIFDLILLGMGPDGHTASLFPNHPLLNVTDQSVAFILDSPKPPPERITLTLPVLNASRSVAFLAAGGGKKEMLQRIHSEPNSGIPSQMVNPKSGDLVWFIDEPAAELLNL
mmetsp:Transcript_2763/g.4863  ORF Transcript_2763/g.4863 Transcript_2763/m.4863 type:complete len:282 (-) Transcript_2763:551-1396(-)|eukprot:CAMPEP_0182442552 /NCGR_PEP_ID=MMETSP1172-20130603/1458_1 /TAXON_ID=708627 /ORGANISM="Timspurckia oligopyrenoides, Strain CCMP3278" /LENGTH=281 /DNA_ID=CAMNT_0024637473 /DNA_START=55 /DNA_END=900 /DNA_ORIENTATION=-